MIFKHIIRLLLTMLAFMNVFHGCFAMYSSSHPQNDAGKKVVERLLEKDRLQLKKTVFLAYKKAVQETKQNKEKALERVCNRLLLRNQEKAFALWRNDALPNRSTKPERKSFDYLERDLQKESPNKSFYKQPEIIVPALCAVSALAGGIWYMVSYGAQQAIIAKHKKLINKIRKLYSKGENTDNTFAQINEMLSALSPNEQQVVKQAAVKGTTAK